MQVREIALRMLLDYEASGKYVNLSLSSHLRDNLGAQDRALLTSLLYTTVEHKLTYDYYIAAFTKMSVDKLSDHTRNILRLGIAQIVDMDRIPGFAAVNETVKLAKNQGERSLVNGVLRNVLRTEELPLPPREKNAARYLSVRYSIPLATVKHFISEIGEAETELLLKHFNSSHGITLTVNTCKISRDAYLEKLASLGYNAKKGEFSQITVKLSDSVNPTELPGFSEGEFFVQDEASAICAAALSPECGEYVADVCAAPGGKSYALAVISSDKAKIESSDLHESKISLIKSGRDRLGFESISLKARDAREIQNFDFERFDAVLCDAPCSGLGVIAKKPDLRYKDISALSELPHLQMEILSASAKKVKRGGRLVYSTCTLNSAENADLVSEFLSIHPEFSVEEFTVGSLSSSGGMLTLYPHVHNTDGFFIAKLRKNK